MIADRTFTRAVRKLPVRYESRVVFPTAEEFVLELGARVVCENAVRRVPPTRLFPLLNYHRIRSALLIEQP